ncbi:MAG: hypothetical protein WCV71_04175 [Patescibacteria group bacterium]|jgi:hypothetical protein
MESERRWSYEHVVLTEYLNRCMNDPYYWESTACSQCQEVTFYNVRRWGCECCYDSQFSWDVLKHHRFETIQQRARQLTPGPDCPDQETNAEFAQRHGISRRQAAKIRQFSRQELKYWI